jgi:lysozyme
MRDEPSSSKWLLGLLLLAGCGAPRAGDASLGSESEAQTVCPAGAVVHGVDVSVFQGNINWPAVKAAGIDFAIARISDGTFMDTQFANNWAGMKAAGVVRGAYQFFEPGDDPTTIANIVIQKVGMLAPDDLPVTADVEVTGGQSPATIAAHLQTWLNVVEAGTGKKPMIYTAPGFWNGSVQSNAFGNYPLWAANWGVNCPNLANGWSNFDIWQYSDMGTVNGIPATVDLDEFNGDLAALMKFAGTGPAYAAKYVTQSFPLATTALVIATGQTVSEYLEMQNVGTATWDTNTKLGTSNPRDRMSVFAAPNWLAPNRLAAVAGMVSPGQSFRFKFDFHAPAQTGTYFEYFNLVQEGVAWFSDAGQGGPADNQLEAQIQVVQPDWAAQFVAQSFPPANQSQLTMAVGDSVDGWFDLKNIGGKTWKAGVTKLAPTPRDKPSTRLKVCG